MDVAALARVAKYGGIVPAFVTFLLTGHRMFMEFNPATIPKFQHWSAIPLRLIVGYGFTAHGYAKIVNGPDHFFAILHALGVPAPQLMGWATILIELLGGLAILTGAFVALASMPMAAILLVAVFTVHLPYGFSSIKLQAVTSAGAQFGQPGYELDLLYLACLAALVLGGSGPLAVDAVLARKSKTVQSTSPELVRIARARS